MTRSPEQYFQEQDFAAATPDTAGKSALSDAECAFVEKYMGIDAGTALKQLGVVSADPPVVALPVTQEGLAEQSIAVPQYEPLENTLRQTNELLMVGFFIGQQEFVVPTLAVQEVIRAMAPAKLPAAPDFVAGVINLRGRVTPLIYLRDMLGIQVDGSAKSAFTIICRCKGLQLGLMIDRVHTMYRVTQGDIDWAVEARLGANVDFVCGLLKMRDELLGIVSVDRIVDAIIKR